MMTWITMVALALAVASLATTITTAAVFAPLRAGVAARSRWFGALLSCPYCFSHWLAIGVVAYYQPRLVTSPWPLLDLFVTAMALVTLTMPLIWIVYRSYHAIVEAEHDEEVRQLRDALAEAREVLNTVMLEREDTRE